MISLTVTKYVFVLKKLSALYISRCNIWLLGSHEDYDIVLCIKTNYQNKTTWKDVHAKINMRHERTHTRPIGMSG